jgi:pyrimidine deaminase RibD-like protein
MADTLTSNPTERLVRQMRLAADAAAASVCPPAVCPPTGCVILDARDRWLSVAAPTPVGVHPEIVALDRAGPLAVGGTAVVTLEPCLDCAVAFARAGIKTVVFAALRPEGSTVSWMQNRGLTVVPGIGEEIVAAGVLAPWLLSWRLRRPFITWAFASSPSGRLALLDTAGDDVLTDLAQLRRQVDAVYADAAESDQFPKFAAGRPVRHVMIENDPGVFLGTVDRVVCYFGNQLDGATAVPRLNLLNARLSSVTQVGEGSVRTVWDFRTP